MSDYSYKLTNHFLKQLEDYEQKFRNIRKDVYESLKNFDTRTSQFLGQKLYKVRINSSDLEKGKSGGFRLIVLVFKTEAVLVPVTLYFKGDKEMISRKELKKHLREVYNQL